MPTTAEQDACLAQRLGRAGTDQGDQGGAARTRQRQARRDVQGSAEEVLADSPFVIIFQQTEVAGLRKNVKGFKLGPTFDTNFVGPVSQGMSRRTHRLTPSRNTQRRPGAQRARASAVAWAVAALPRHRRHHLSRAARRHLLHRPRHPDRSGAGHRRRPRAASVVERAREEYGLNLPLYQQFFLYVKDALTGNFGTLGADHQSGDDRHPPRLSGDDRACDARHAHRRRSRRAARRARRGQARQHHRPDRARHRPDRLFRADLLARAVCAARLLREAAAGSPGPGRIDIAYEYTFTPITGFYLLDAVLQRRLGRVPRHLPPHHPAGLRCSAISRSPISAA